MTMLLWFSQQALRLEALLGRSPTLIIRLWARPLGSVKGEREKPTFLAFVNQLLCKQQGKSSSHLEPASLSVMAAYWNCIPWDQSPIWVQVREWGWRRQGSYVAGELQHTLQTRQTFVLWWNNRGIYSNEWRARSSWNVGEVFGSDFLKEGWKSQNAEQFRRRVGMTGWHFFEFHFPSQNLFRETMNSLLRLMETLIIEMPTRIQNCLQVSGKKPLKVGVFIS